MSSQKRPVPCPFLKVTVTLAGRDFEFDLCHRRLSLGTVGDVDYYWMDSSRFRGGLEQPDEAFLNYRNCLGLWWRATKIAAVDQDPVQIAHFLLAQCYSIFSRDKALQHVFHDAFLRDDVEFELLSDEEQIRQALLGPVDGVQFEDSFKTLLTESHLTTKEVEVVSVALQAILEDGVNRFRIDKQQGLIDFLSKVESWSSSVRRRGGHPMRRLCLNQFAYSAKVSFYRCYATAWIHIVAELERWGLDERSSRFLRFWHWQNQPVEQADGSVKPDVFGGQVLALHPLSRFFMQSPALRETAGRFFSKIPEAAFDQQDYGCSDEYRSLLQALQIAAYRYESARRNQEDKRRSKQAPNTKHAHGSVDIASSESHPPEDALTECLGAEGERCNGCGCKLVCTAFETDQNRNLAIAEARCVRCGVVRTVDISYQTFLKTFGF